MLGVFESGYSLLVTFTYSFRPYRQEPWHECFTTVSKKEFEALIYSLYVMARDDKKLDGYE